MLFLPAAALCCLGSALAAMATQLIQEDLTLTRKVGQSVSFTCGTGQCGGSWRSWYQKKETETFRALLWVDTSDGEIRKNSDHPQINDFSISYTHNSVELKISKAKLTHAASYYCDCWKSGSGAYEYLFGSGTRLYVTGKPLVKPSVTVCPVKTEGQVEGKMAVMCLAYDMFPPLVQISWKRQKKDSTQETLPPADEKQLELSGNKNSAVIRLVNNQSLYEYEYICEVQHEKGKERNQTTFQVPSEPSAQTTSPPPTPPKPAAVSPPSGPAAASVPPQLPVKLSVSFQSRCRVKLLCLLYTVLIVKSLVYCCGLSLFMILRNNKKPSTM